MARFHSIGHYQFAPEDHLLFDTNVWIPLFDCRTDPREDPISTKIYAGALKRALERKSRLFTHPLIVAEFVNRMVRDEHHFRISCDEADRNFKIWRRSSTYRDFAEVVAAQTREFLKKCMLIQHTLCEEALEKCLLAFEEDARDINDEMLVEVCQSNRLSSDARRRLSLR